MDLPAPSVIAGFADRSGFSEMPLTREAFDALSSLPLHHRDPFDRMLIAQAMTRGLRIVTPDKWFSAYKVKIEIP